MPPDDQERPATAANLREFKDEVRIILRDLNVSVRALEAGQAEIRIQFEKNRAEDAQTAASARMQGIIIQAKESERISKIDAKTALMWGGWIALIGIVAKLLGFWLTQQHAP